MSKGEMYRNTVEDVETVYETLNDLFGEDSSENGLLSVRNNTLHQFNIIGSSYHHLNSINFVKGSAELSKIFDEELKTANYRTHNYRESAVKRIKSNLEKLEEYLEEIEELYEDILHLQKNAKDMFDTLNNSYYIKILHSVNYYLQEIVEKVVKPAMDMINSEIDAAHKMIEFIELRADDPDISNEEVARMCEVLSWGLEVPPGWESVQNESSELSQNLEKKLGSLRALAVTT